MEINITTLFNSIAPMDYSASCGEIGQNAGADTWRAACEDADDVPILDNDEKREAFRALVSSAGAWEDPEIVAWSNTKLSALFLQWVAKDMRDMGIHRPVSGPVNWARIESEQSAGRCASNIYRGDDGQVYFYAGS